MCMQMELIRNDLISALEIHRHYEEQQGLWYLYDATSSLVSEHCY
jgi:hypothetical protein